MKWFSVLVLAWFLFGIVCTHATDQEAVQKEMAKFNGIWTFVSLEVEGNKLTEEQLKQWGKLILKDGTFTVQQGDRILQGTFRVGPGKKPKEIDVTFIEGPDRKETLLGIYELEGDIYKVCLGMTGKARPTEFVTRPGSGHVLEILKREKP